MSNFQKKERILYFDVIKLFAVICVFTCHFSRTLEYYNIYYTFKIIPDYLFSLYLGSVGVSLFFIISGASLMYVYDDNINLVSYYKKRFLGIYPMFWIAYLIFFGLNFYVNKGFNNYSIPTWHLIYTLFGCDGAFAFFTGTFHLLGEWFLIVIILLYAIFPLLRVCVKKFPLITFIMSLAISVILEFSWHFQMPIDAFFIARIAEFIFGMIFIKYIKKVRIWMFIPALACLVIFSIFNFQPMPTMPHIILVGISLFLILVFIFSNIKLDIFIKISHFISKYCYPIFLVHHALMMLFIRHFAGATLNKTNVIILYIITAVLTLLSSSLLPKITNIVQSCIQNLFDSACNSNK